MKTKILKVMGTVCCLLFLSASAWAYAVLPDPTEPYVAIKYDDFYSYVPKVLDQLGYSGFDSSTGTGTLDLLLYSGNSADSSQTFDLGDGQIVVFPSAIDEPNPSPTDYSPIWPIEASPSTFAFSVDDFAALLDYLYGTTIPVFAYDLNQTGSETGIYATAKFWVGPDADFDNAVAFWALDALDNDAWDELAKVYAPADIEFTMLVDGTYKPAGTEISVKNLNIGGGAGDFVGYAPTMDLALYTEQGLNFYFQPYFYGLNNGAEEIWITGAYRVPGTPVPEPGSLILLGMALLGVAAYGRNRKR